MWRTDLPDDANGGVIEALDDLGPVDEALATLTAVLGEAPGDEPIAAGNHNPAGVRHTRGGGGLTVTEHLLTDEERARYPHPLYWPRFAVAFSAAELNGVLLETADGAHVDEEWAVAVEDIDPALWTCSGLAVEHIEIARGDSGTGLIGVGISEMGAGWVATGSITAVYAPVAVADGCA